MSCVTNLRIAAAVLVLAATALAQAVHTVDPVGGDFATIQAALDAAAPGDIVLVTGGSHENVVIQKGVVLVGAGGGFITKAAAGPGVAQPPLRVVGIPAGESVVVAGLTVFTVTSGATAAVEVSGCAGAVWLQDLFVDSYGSDALVVEGCASTVVAGSIVQVNLVPALPDGTPQAGAGGRVSGATRGFLHDTWLVGSHGTLVGPGDPVPNAAAPGGPGLVVEDAWVRVAGGLVNGGSGNSFHSAGCSSGGDGGPGLVTADGPAPGLPSVTLEQVGVSGGFGGFFDAGCAPPPSSGPAFDSLRGSVSIAAGTARRFSLPPVVKASQGTVLELDGVAGDVALLFGAQSGVPAKAVGALDLHLQAGTLFLVAVLPLAGASLDLGAGVPALPAGVEAVAVPLQAVFLDAQGGKHDAGPRCVVVRG